jgi:hypothetical protein
MYLTHDKYIICVSVVTIFIILQLDIDTLKEEKDMDIESRDLIGTKTDKIYTFSSYPIIKTEDEVSINSDVLCVHLFFVCILLIRNLLSFRIVMPFLISQVDIDIVKDEKDTDIWSQEDFTDIKTDEIYPSSSSSSSYSIQKTEAKVCIY